MKRKKEHTNFFVHLFFILFCVACIIPFMIVITMSLTSVRDMADYGFRVWPKNIDFSAYAYLFTNPKKIINAYGVTIYITIVGTFLSVLFTCMAAYPLARPNFRFKKLVTFYLYMPTLFGGGLVASYIVNTNILHLRDSLWVMILPGLVGAMSIFMIRTFFQTLPAGLFDAAKIDGANEIRICFDIAIRLSKPAVATIAFMGAFGRWNEWYNAMLYIDSSEKYPLQYLLQRMMMNLQELLKAMEQAPGIMFVDQIPGENLRMALLVVCIGPMMCLFPFFQKYFVKGMTIGSVKG